MLNLVISNQHVQIDARRLDCNYNQFFFLMEDPVLSAYACCSVKPIHAPVFLFIFASELPCQLDSSSSVLMAVFAWQAVMG